jgi:hypothetical protein
MQIRSVLSGLKPLHMTYYGWHDLPLSKYELLMVFEKV